MGNNIYPSKHVFTVIAVIIALCTIQSCCWLAPAGYSEDIHKLSSQTCSRIENHFNQLQAANESDRKFDRNSENYSEISKLFDQLILKSNAEKCYDDFTFIFEKMKESWLQMEQSHKSANTVSSPMIKLSKDIFLKHCEDLDLMFKKIKK